MNSATQKQALTAGVRTALQTFKGSLVVILGAGGLLGAVGTLEDIQWVALGSALAAGALVAIVAGADSYLNWTINGIPGAYTQDAPEAPVGDI